MAQYAKKFLKNIHQEELYQECLTANSRITVRCQNCSSPRTSSLKVLNQSFKKTNRIWCRNCIAKDLADSNLQKRKKTLLKKYGVDNPLKSKAIRKKVEKTNLLKYGFKNQFQNEEIKREIKKTNLIKYGVANPGQRKDQIEKVKEWHKKNLNSSQERLLKRTGEESIKSFDDKVITFLEENIDLSPCSKIVAELMNCSVDTISQVLTRNNRKDLLKNISSYENVIYSIIKTLYNGPIIKNDRKLIKPYELDIYLPELKIAFEFNGLYWHSEKFRENNYHKNKWLACKERGVKLFTIWEYQWGEAWENMIKKLVTPKKVIYARKTSISRDKIAIQAFIEKNHIQGKGFAKEVVGLEFEGSIVAALTIASHHRTGSEMSLNRVCFGGHSVVGGLDKMLKALEYKGALTTWSDNCYSPDPTLYENAGFKKVSELRPDYFYVDKNGQYHSKQSKKKSLIGCPKEEKEHEFLAKQGFWRVWDCGKIKWVKIIK